MSRRSRRRLPDTPFEADISGLSHDGRGVTDIEGKKVFVHGALPGERVRFRLTARQRSFDEGEVTEVLQASPDRVEPRCPHFQFCGGCALQHQAPQAQILAKQDTLLQNLRRIGQVEPEDVLPPLSGPQWHYRRKARLSVRRVTAKQRVLVGFRERRGRYVADMDSCEILDSRAARLLPRLPALIDSLSCPERIPQIEVACGDEICALVFRHLEPLTADDHERLRAFAIDADVAVLLQPGGPDTITALEPESVTLAFTLPAHDIELVFGPADFIQVNAELNRAMIDLALEHLRPEPQHAVLDLYCGLGNFTLPLARRAASVVGVEGDAALVGRAAANARHNGLDNVVFHTADLAGDLTAVPWLRGSYDRVLLDPPRSGAEVVLPAVAASGAERIVYVSCHPASLARDAGILTSRHGYRLEAAGVMDMFPHTGHVESIAVFGRAG
ncbi:23S rRNA (uracil(1939)-C(5))-methyltransferase RlmD [Elongatibacter sediminis]|uniref:23S rRNA (uracil(1939)-C(5))-methyltransferase RlmD n=1 Tax=Elongatibacter sediminis TaxID=3119006 RepID=A0AAW9RGF7_9GAMM